MPTIYESNFKVLMQLFGDNLNGQFPEYLRFEAGEGLMPLTFDLLSEENGKIQYAMTHWYESNGDLIADPEMIIEIKGKTLEALSIQHPYPFNRVWNVYNSDRSRYDPRQKKEQNRFLKQWLKNIHIQGYKRVIMEGEGPALYSSESEELRA
jgi:uncharacterized protein YqiB (DUF1249 family)